MFFLLLAAGALALALFVLTLAGPGVLRLAVGVLVALTVASVPAHAETSFVGDLFGSVVWPILVPAFWAVAAVGFVAAGNAVWKLINRALDLFERKTGIEVAARHREALHSALETGLQLAIKRGAPIVEDAVAAWVGKSVPDAVAHFGLTPEMLDGLVDAKLGKASIAAAAAGAVGAPLQLPGALLSGLAGAAAAPLEIVGAAG